MRIVTGGRGGRVDPVVMPDTTEGVVPPAAVTDCIGADERPLTLADAPLVGPLITALSGFHAAGNEDRTIGDMSSTACTTVSSLLVGKTISSGWTLVKSSIDIRFEKYTLLSNSTAHTI